MKRALFIFLVLSLITMDAQAAGEQKATVFKDWALGCDDQGSNCLLEQRVFVEGLGQTPLVRMTFKALAAEADGRTARSLWVLLNVPLGVQLAAGLKLQVDRGAPFEAAYHHCHSAGCLALFPLGSDLRKTLETGQQAAVTFQMLDGRSVGVPVSLQGLAAGLAALEEKMRAAN